MPNCYRSYKAKLARCQTPGHNITEVLLTEKLWKYLRNKTYVWRLIPGTQNQRFSNEKYMKKPGISDRAPVPN
ncbi:hypothetical protein QUB63_14060 [Microcoleus sp. ARI1-B5]|uniref:hypothetical protein n=1 Tax=unclassified Microcoleus TaxID=2642155 RepID=UPI002FD55317